MIGNQLMANTALGVLELRGDTAGLQTLDVAAKSANLHSIYGQPICPGSFLIMLTGTVSAVQTAVNTALASVGLGKVEARVITSVHPSIWPALTASHSIKQVESMVAIETEGAAVAIETANSLVKGVAIDLWRIRLASGLCGHGLILAGGTTAQVTTATTMVKELVGDYLVACRTLTAPHPRLFELVM